MITEQQRIDRRLGIGGSDMPIILGLSNYKTPYQLYLEKIGESDDSQESTQAQRLGSALEDDIKQEFELQHNVTIETPDTRIHPFYEFMRANVDGYIPFYDAIWECKTTTYKSNDEWRSNGIDTIPDRHIIQAAFYCAVFNCQRAYISVFFTVTDLRELVFERNLELEEQIIDRATIFWNCVQTRTPPEPLREIDIRLMYPAHQPSKVKVIKKPIADQLSSLADTRFKIKHLNAAEETYKFNIMRYMEDAEELVDESGKPLVSWKANKRGARTFLMKGV